MSFIIKIILNGVGLLMLDKFIDSIHVNGFVVALISVIVLSVINALIKPILSILALPITFLTLGLFTFVINGLTFYLTALFVPGFEVKSFIAAIIGAAVMSFISLITSSKK